MNLRDLNYVVQLAKHRHFGRAAEASFVSQPTLSMQIKKLEEELGVLLFEREKTNVRVTDAGQELLGRVESILYAVDELKVAAQSYQDPCAGVFQLGLFPTVAPYFLPLVLPAIQKDMPNLSLRLHELMTDELVTKLLSGEVDAIIIAASLDDAALMSVPFFKEEFSLVVPEKHSLSERERILGRQIPENELMLLSQGHCMRGQGLEYCHRIRKGHQAEFSATSLETLISMIQMGGGVTLLPGLAIPVFQKRRGIKILPIQAAPYRELHLCWRKSSLRTVVFEQLLDIFRERLH